MSDHIPPIPIDHLRLHRRTERPDFTPYQPVWVEAYGLTVAGFFLGDSTVEQMDGKQMMRVRIVDTAQHRLAGETCTVAWQQVRHRATEWRPTNVLEALGKD